MVSYYLFKHVYQRFQLMLYSSFLLRTLAETHFHSLNFVYGEQQRCYKRFLLLDENSTFF